MRLSEYLTRDILETGVGSVFNKFKVAKRRPTFFFDDIGLEYLKRIEDSDRGERLREISTKWGFIMYDNIFPDTIKRLPWSISVNVIMREIFRLLGYMEGIHCRKDRNMITLTTHGEENIRAIGMNNLHIGLYMGLLSVVFKRDMKLISSEHLGDGNCVYRFRAMKNLTGFPSKGKKLYDRLNKVPEKEGQTLNDALRKKTLNIRDNRIYFRGTRITSLENTLFHLFGNSGLLLEQVPEISFDYFRPLVRKGSSSNEKLKLIKNLLQAMGWGMVRIVSNGRRIKFIIDYPPYGFQKEEDNWDFLANVILGYLWILDRGFRIISQKAEGRRLAITYGKPVRTSSPY